jgi:(p)ppGpp synthase/HD superfamily hydrolase
VREVDRAEFILLPLEVAALLSGRGFDDKVVAAGLLHGAVEDTAWGSTTSGRDSASGSAPSWPP